MAVVSPEAVSRRPEEEPYTAGRIGETHGTLLSSAGTSWPRFWRGCLARKPSLRKVMGPRVHFTLVQVSP